MKTINYVKTLAILSIAILLIIVACKKEDQITENDDYLKRASKNKQIIELGRPPPVGPPVAEFTVQRTYIITGSSVDFTDQSTNSPTSWSWNFGDGGTSASENPSHTFNTTGIYTVSLTATNTAGSDTETKTNYMYVSTIVDYDGNTYETARIGNDEWMIENLKSIHYASGTAIPLVTGQSAWNNLGYNDKAYCYYNNNANGEANTYGALYTWAAAMDGESSSSSNPSGVQGVCPTGWHLPSDAEWTELTNYLGGSTVAGGKMKETGTTHWSSPNYGATNSSGFTALPGGMRTDDGNFDNFGLAAQFYGATQYSSSAAYNYTVAYNSTYIWRGYVSSKASGFTVRCVKNL